ncbi:hypothetical protein C2845_PM16G22040 [Panicum miliaceum]|uniref:Uncharacterized protein n=1 Tax=Panicum miliaceum TaxID=4540 RepID=A0A3L6PWZ1_PANMI|nr:hypothetical protein C2845_PM16G22040 [Panicum miliaceum]
MAFAYEVTCLKEIQDILRDHEGDEGVSITFAGRLASIAEATGMWRLLEDMEQQGWLVENSTLEPFTYIDSAIARAHGLADYVLGITEPAAADHPGSSTAVTAEMLLHKSVRLSTSMSSPDYGTAAFAKRVADKLHNRHARSQEGIAASPADRAAFAGVFRVDNSPDRSLPADRAFVANSPGRLLSDERARDASLPGRYLSAERARVDNSPDRSLPADRAFIAKCPGRLLSAERARDASLPGRYLSAERARVASFRDRSLSAERTRIAGSPGRSLSPERARVVNSSGRCLSPERAPDVNFPGRSLSAGRGRGGNSPGRSLSPERGRGGNSPGRSLSAGRGRGGNSPGRSLSAGRGRGGNPSPRRLYGQDHRDPSPRRSASRRRREDRPAGRFVTPEVATRVSEAGLELMRMPLDKVRALGERMQELGIVSPATRSRHLFFVMI